MQEPDAIVSTSPHGRVSRCVAFARVLGLYAIVQLVAYFVLATSCSTYAVRDIWLKGALGPMAAVEAIPRFQYHSLLENAGFVLFCVALLAMPFAYVVRPCRATFVVSAVSLVIWCVFGWGFSIDNM